VFVVEPARRARICSNRPQQTPDESGPRALLAASASVFRDSRLFVVLQAAAGPNVRPRTRISVSTMRRMAREIAAIACAASFAPALPLMDRFSYGGRKVEQI